MQMSFSSAELAQRLKRDSVLMQINAQIDWRQLRPHTRWSMRKQAMCAGNTLHRAYKNQPLSARQKLANKLISKKTLCRRTVFWCC